MADSNNPSFRQVLVAKKEISLGWLVGAVAQGLVSFAVLGWTAATLVSDVTTLKTTTAKLEEIVTTSAISIAAHASELQRQAEYDKGLTQRVDEHGKRLDRIEDRRGR